MRKRYRSVGPQALSMTAAPWPARAEIRQPDDFFRWLAVTQPSRGRQSTIIVTFIIDLAGHLWVADRHSEHVACAAGQDVLAAGEMTFEIGGGLLSVTEATNQSTGYCPEPESWEAVQTALEQLGVEHPSGYTSVCLFRRCDCCGSTNLIKEQDFTCAVCGAPLSQEWNYL